jgi:hypothetical protein
VGANKLVHHYVVQKVDETDKHRAEVSD